MLFKEKNKSITFRIDDYTFQKLVILADKLELNVSQLSRKAVVQFISMCESNGILKNDK